MSKSQVKPRKRDVARWVIYALVALVVVLPYFIKLPVKFEPSDKAKMLYERVNALKPGSHILIAFDFDPAAQAELEPMSRAILRHCFQKEVIPVIVTHWAAGVGLTQRILEETAAEVGNKRGKPVESERDYVFLGFKPGGANLVLNMGENLKAAFDKDYYGRPTADMPALQGVKSLKDIDMGIDLAAGNTVEMWIAYGSDRFGFPLGVGTTAVQAPNMYPYVQSKQLVGFLGGLRGAADYESLVNSPGAAVAGMQAQSAAHVLLVVLILGANIRLIAKRLGRGQKG